MNHDKLIINGCVYIKETTEPVKRERERYLVKGDNLLALWKGDRFSFGRVGYACGDAPNASELFVGEIIISQKDLLQALFKESHYEVMNDDIRAYCERVFNNLRELFK